MPVNRHFNFSRQKCDQEEAKKILKFKDVECKNKSDNSNNKGNWNRLRIIEKIPEQHTWKA